MAKFKSLIKDVSRNAILLLQSVFIIVYFFVLLPILGIGVVVEGIRIVVDAVSDATYWVAERGVMIIHNS